MSASTSAAAGHLRALPPEIVEAAERAGRAYGVSGALSHEDYIFWFIYDNLQASEKIEASKNYIESGRHVATLLRDLVDEARLKSILGQRPDAGQPLSILEFASGYGRVTRHIPNMFPGVELTACDIHDSAVRFLNSIGLNALKSSHIPEKLELGRTFDVIFVFSFFTHMPRRTWKRWLGALTKHLSPDGLLIFSTHGEVSQGLMRVTSLEEDGFFFHAVSEQKDLELSEYGNTVTTFEFVYSQIRDVELKLLKFNEASAGHQDVYVLQRREGAIHYSMLCGGHELVGRIVAENDRLAGEIMAVRQSKSWRLTAPLRRLSRVLKGR